MAETTTEIGSKLVTLANLSDYSGQVKKALGGKVDKESGKGLTTNDYTTAEKEKLAGIAEGADAVSISRSATSGNKVGTITINGTATDLYAGAVTSVSGNAGSATKLATARAIDGVSFNGSAAITHYGTCSTAAATAEKAVAVNSFTLVTGSRVVVKFTVANTAASPTLNVNGTGAKSIFYRGAAIATGILAANRVYEFVYDGTQYQLVGDLDTNTTYSAASQSAAGLMSAADKKKLDGIAAGATATSAPQNGTLTIGIAESSSATPTAVTTFGANQSGSSALTLVPGENVTLEGGADSGGRVVVSAPIAAATTGAAGLMSAADKSKLDGIAAGATKTAAPSYGTYKVQTVVGSTTTDVASAASNAGWTLQIVQGSNITLTPDASGKKLTIAATDTKYNAASQSAAGLMSASDKTKLDGIATGANKTVVDSSLSSTSTNPVQNKAVNTALAGKQASLSSNQLTGINAIAGYTLATDDEVTSVWENAAAAS